MGSKRVCFFNRDGSDYEVADYHCGRYLGRYPLVQIEECDHVKVGDVQHRHAGFGVFHDWKVVDMDEHTVFIQRI